MSFGSRHPRAAFGVLPFSFLLLLAWSAPAQTGPAPAVAPSPMTKVNVDEVSVDLVVHDKSGKDIPDLKSEELEVLDGSSPVRINNLRRVSAAPGSDRSHSVTLVFDQLDAGNAKSARDAALALLKAIRESEIAFTVLRVDSRLHLLQAPTTDRDAVTKAVTAATVADKTDYVLASAEAEKSMTEDTQAGPRQANAKMLLAMMLDSQKLAEDPHTTPSVAALLAVSRGQQRIPGRKTVIYFSQSLSWNVSAPEGLRAIMDAANRSHVSIYSMDAHVVDPQAANGMVASVAISNAGSLGRTGVAAPSGGGPAGSPSAAGAGTGSQVGEQMGRFEQGDQALGKAPLETICQRTGGAHEITGGRGAKKIAEDLSASYYVVSFTPATQADDGRFRSVRVRALRSGLAIQSRAGYFALPRRAAPVSPAFEGALLGALAAPKPPRDLPFLASAFRFGHGENRDANAVVVEVPFSGVEVRTDAATKTYAAHVAVLTQLKNKAGVVVQKFSEDLPRQGALEDQERIRRDALVVRRHFSAEPGDYVLETAAMDVNSGKIGAARVDLVIPPTSNRASLGDVVLVGKIEPYSGDADAENDRADPLRCVDGRVVPNLSGRVSKAAYKTVTLFFDIHPDTASTDVPDVKVEVRRSGTLIGIVPLRMPQDTKKATIPYLAELGTASLAIGDYRLTMVLKQGVQTASASVSFALGD
jgi:VWFA-related protein